MILKGIIISFSVLFLIVLVLLSNSLDSKLTPSQPSKNPCIPTFADGDGPYYLSNSPFRQKLVPDKNNGQKMLVQGKVLKNDCQTPLTNTVVDIWQADETGKYQNDWYRGRFTTSSDGSYSFETVMPKGYGEGTAFRPPHIHFKIWENDKLLITSEMFFPEVRGRPGFEDAYIVSLEEKNEWGQKVLYAYHDIIIP